MIRSALLQISALLAPLFVVQSLSAEVLFNTGGVGFVTSFQGEPITSGFNFTVGSNALLLSSMGIWDENLDGLVSAHQVGLWSSTGTLLTSLVVPAGVSGSLIGEFRFMDLSVPISLDPGQEYVLGAHYADSDPDRYRFNTSAGALPTSSPEVSLVGSRFTRPFYGSSPDGFGFPDKIDAVSGATIGPNLQFVIIPEPTTFTLLSLGSLALVRMRRV